jgi:hypothetical protein
MQKYSFFCYLQEIGAIFFEKIKKMPTFALPNKSALFCNLLKIKILSS